LEIPDPDKVLRKAGVHRWDLEKLAYDDEIYQAISTREEGLQTVPVRLEPTESKASKFIVERCLTPKWLRALTFGAFNALLYGYSIMEII